MRVCALITLVTLVTTATFTSVALAEISLPSLLWSMLI